LTFNGLHGVISQKTVLFITTAVRASNPIIEKRDHFLQPSTQSPDLTYVSLRLAANVMVIGLKMPPVRTDSRIPKQA
jgi:hypothetical protein